VTISFTRRVVIHGVSQWSTDFGKFCFQLGKTALELHEMLKTDVSDNAMRRTQTFEWFA
jgi:hypothetical protein